MTTHDPTPEPALDAAFQRELQRYLAGGPSQAPEEVVTATRAAVAGTRQAGWRRWLDVPSLARPMTLVAPVALALAVAAFLVAVRWLPRDQEPAATPMPPPTHIPAVIGAEFSSPGTVDGITVAGDQLWIVAGIEVSRLDAGTGAVVRTVQAAEPQDALVRLIGTPSTVYALSPTLTTTFVTVIPAGGGDAQVIDLDLQEVIGVAVGEELWFAGAQEGVLLGEPGRQVKRVDPTGNVSTIAGMPSVTALGTDGIAVYGVTLAKRLIRVDPVTRQIFDSVPLEPMDGELVLAGGPAGLWVLADAPAGLFAYEIDGATGNRRSSVRLGSTDPVRAVLADRTGLWIATADAEAIKKLVPGGITTLVDLPFRSLAAAAGEQSIWLRRAGGDLVRVDLPVD